MPKTIVLDDGKYTVVFDKTNSYPEWCLRYGDEWRKLTGDNLIFWLCVEIDKLQANRAITDDELNEYKNILFTNSYFATCIKKIKLGEITPLGAIVELSKMLAKRDDDEKNRLLMQRSVFDVRP